MAQEAALAVLRASRSDRPPDDVVAYCRTVVRRLAAADATAACCHSHDGGAVATRAYHELRAERPGALDDELRAHLVASLNERERRVLELHGFDARPVREVARVLGLTPGQVRRAWQRILARARGISRRFTP